MKNINKTLALVVLLCSWQLARSQNFITQWNLATAGSGATQLSFSTATSGTVNYTWQEISPGSASGAGTWSGATLTIAGLPTGATIRLQIAPTNFQRIIINNGTDRNRLTQVENWGSTAWTSMQSAFYGCANLQVTATDVPNLLDVTNMSEMFRACINLNSPGNIGSWNTAAVTTMYRMFYSANAFNQNIGAWNTAAVTDMSEMFHGASAFNQNIGPWNTGAVITMSEMFYNASSFNQNIGTWNTGAVSNMYSLFYKASAFNQNIGAWNTAAVTDMEYMFYNAGAFNQNIGAWNTAAVTTMSEMFSNAGAFNQDIGAWNTGAVTSMFGMFSGATLFNQNIGAWTLNPAVNMSSMLSNSGMGCNNYSATLIGWSANPSTPNGRTLGASGRQYGTNAAVARTNLVSTKSWTITGDTPSGVVCATLPPTITNFTPASGPIGTTITITGTNFSTIPANNIVYFGATRATVTAATSTQLTATVPVGATYQLISVLVNGLTAFSGKPFITTFPDGGVIDACSFAANVDVTTGSAPYSVAIGDLDADGKPDLAVANKTSNTVSVYKNISTRGSLTSSSFAVKVDFVTGAKPYFVTIQDLDGDGKPELIVTNNDADKVSIYKNNTSLGVINSSSFAAKVDFSTGENPWNATIGDFDLDGKPDLAIVNDVGNSVSILKNTSSIGTIDATSFAANVDFVTGNFPIGIASGDLDGDGKMDLAVTNQADNSFSVLRNTSTTGIINASSFATKIDFPTGLDPYSVAIGDLDGDNKPEIAVGNYSSGSVSVFENTSTPGSITLSPKVDFVSGGGSLTVSITDVDGDGKPDLSVTNGGARISILKNLSTAPPIALSSFSPKVDFTTTSDSYGLAIGDLDGNGKPDLVSTNFNGTTASILRNTVSSLPVFVASSFSPTSGPVGTTVTITGTNFSTTPLNNTVKFNGAVATVTASTSTSITAIVPVGATTGSISLEIGCITALTVFPFTVTTGNTITITSQPTFTYACEGSTATFSADATGTINITYRWQKHNGTDFVDINDGAGYTGTNTKILSINTATTGFSGNGQYRCRINGDLATEVFTDAAQLTINGLPSPPDVTGDTDCVSPATLTLTAMGASDGDYNWYDVATGGSVLGTNGSFTTPSIPSTKTFYVSISDTFCESDRVPVDATISLLTKPSFSSSLPIINGDINICDGEVLTITAPAGFSTYTWSNGATSNPITITTSTASLTLQVTDGAGCVSPLSDALNIVVNSYPVAVITPDGAQLTASAGDSYQWYQNGNLVAGSTSQSFEYDVLEYGVYLVDVTDNGCTTTSDPFEYLITKTENNATELKVFPNPIDHEFYIESANPLTIALTDVTGRVVFTAHQQSGKAPFNVFSLSSGIYFLTIQQGSKIYRLHVIKK